MSALALGLTVPYCLSAQTHITLNGAPRCTSCRVAVDRAAVLSDSEFAIDAFATRVFRDVRGRFYVTGERSSLLGVYSPEGAFLRQVGRRGGGLGEYEQINWMIQDSNGRIQVFDFAQRRRTLLDPDSFKPLTSFPAPPINEAVQLSAGEFLGSGSIPSTAAAGEPLHVVRSDGSIERSFGAESPSFRRETAARSMYRLLARARTGGFWSSPLLDYRIDLWSSSLESKITYARDVDWFPPSLPDAQPGRPDRDRPPTTVRGIWEDSDGLLWVNIGVPKRNWRPSTSSSGAPRGEGPVITQRQVAELFDTVIEVIDPRDGVVLVSARLEGHLAPISGGEFHWILREDSGGGFMLEVVRLRLVR